MNKKIILILIIIVILAVIIPQFFKENEKNIDNESPSIQVGTND